MQLAQMAASGSLKRGTRARGFGNQSNLEIAAARLSHRERRAVKRGDGYSPVAVILWRRVTVGAGIVPESRTTRTAGRGPRRDDLRLPILEGYLIVVGKQRIDDIEVVCNVSTLQQRAIPEFHEHSI